MAKDPWSRPSLAAELIQAASRALSSSATHLAPPSPADGRDGGAERDRRVQTTKVPAVGATGDGAGDGNAAGAASAEERAARSGVTRARSVIPPVAPTPGPEASHVVDEIPPVPWIAQLGQGRGGFYSYDFLENLVGCDIHSADRIVPEWQDDGSRRRGQARSRGRPARGRSSSRADHWFCVAGSRWGQSRLRTTSPGRSSLREQAGRNDAARSSASDTGTRGRGPAGRRARRADQLHDEPEDAAWDQAARGANKPPHGEPDALAGRELNTEEPGMPGSTLLAAARRRRTLRAIQRAHLRSGRGASRAADRLRPLPLRARRARAGGAIRDRAGASTGPRRNQARCRRRRRGRHPWAGRFRIFRYEVRRWRDGVIPDIAEAVESPQRLTNDPGRAQRVLDLAPGARPSSGAATSSGTGEMWNSNSFIAWLLARSGLDAGSIRPPAGGRAPGPSPDLRFASLMDMDFAVSRPLVRRLRLVPGFCPSARTFAVRFLQTSPRGDSPCVIANPSPPSGWVEDFHLQATEHAQHTTKPLAR